MATAMIYVFKEPRQWKKKSALSFSFYYGDQDELQRQIITQINEPDVYHVTAFNVYGNMVAEIYKSETTKGKNYGRKNTKEN